MFSSCSSLTSVSLLNTDKVTNMNGTFQSCSKLTSVSLSNTSKVTDMTSLFNNCSSLVVAPQLDTSGATNIRYMFSGCLKLETIPQYNTSKATNMNGMFQSCTLLTQESLNNILQMCINATSFTGTKTLKYLGLSSTQATTCQSLSNYQAFLNAGWTTGY